MNCSEPLMRVDANLEFLPYKLLEKIKNLSQNLGSLDNLDSLEKEKFFFGFFCWRLLLLCEFYE
jgi:hypothetical protein